MSQTDHTCRRRWLATAARAALSAVASTCLLAPIPASAQASDWPTRPIKIIVPFPAGSFTDATARVLSDRFSNALGQPVVVDNKSGANGLIGVAEAVKAAPDGYTLLVTNSSSVAINPQLYKNAPYKTSDLTPITMVLEAPFILVTNPAWAQKNAVNSLKGLLQFASQNPGKLNYGSAGAGNIAHLGFATMSNKANITATHVPYRSSAQAQLALLGGELDAGFDTWTALPHIAAGKLKPLAVTSTQRMTQLPDVPTVEEAGVTPFEVTFWIGLLAPAGTPSDIVQKLASLSRSLLEDQRVQSSLGAQGNVVMLEPAAFAKRVTREVAEWEAVIRRENLSLD